MNRLDIQRLQAVRGYPLVSILLPTHRTSPENKRDPILVKNLVTEATNRLHQEFSKREAQGVLARLDELVDRVDYAHALDGLALFAGEGFADLHVLPFRVEPRVVVDETFATRDLVYALNRSQRYRVLVLSEKPTRLYEALHDDLEEVVGHGFPATHDGPGGSLPLPGGQGVSRSAVRDEQHRQFFRRVDAALAEIEREEPLPLVVVGVDRYLAFFSEVARREGQVLGRVTGSHDKTPPHELGKLVWPVAREGFTARRQQVLAELDQAMGARRVASGIDAAWKTAGEGRVGLLLVEKGFRYPATEEGGLLKPATDATAAGVIDDAVDELIETVLAKGGRVEFVDDGALQLHQRVAAALRY